MREIVLIDGHIAFHVSRRKEGVEICGIFAAESGENPTNFPSSS